MQQGNNGTTDGSFDYNVLPKQGFSNSLHDVGAIDPYRQAEQMRVMPRQLSTGSQRGTMTIQGKLVVQNPLTNERILIGSYNDEFGIFQAQTVNGDENVLNVAKKTIGVTDYYFDLDTGRNFAQFGKLPDGTFNLVLVDTPSNVVDVFA